MVIMPRNAMCMVWVREDSKYRQKEDRIVLQGKLYYYTVIQYTIRACADNPVQHVYLLV